jgi:ABC-type dipeptide/oligopeptide/nickel transport system permease component
MSSIPVLLALTATVFFLMQAIPGGPFDYMGDKSIPASVRENLLKKYHLDEPVSKQYLRFLWDLGHGDLGPSFRYRGRSVNDIIKDTLPVSAQLGALALCLALFIGIPAGIFAALRQNSWIDYSSTFVAVIGVSIPNMVLGPLLIWVFAVWLGVLPAALWGTPARMILPTITLGTALSARIARMTRASLLQVIREDYIRTARAKGLKERLVVVRHALKNSLIPVITVLGPLFAAILTGTFVVEQIFGIPGMGKHFIQSVGNRDYPVIMGVTLLYAIALVIANLLVDITYAWLDPRIRYD